MDTTAEFTDEEIAEFIRAEEALRLAEEAALTPEAIAEREAIEALRRKQAEEWAAAQRAEKERVEGLKARVTEILKSAGIEMSVWGCGCNDSPLVSFSLNGEVILDDEGDFNFNTNGETDD